MLYDPVAGRLGWGALLQPVTGTEALTELLLGGTVPLQSLLQGLALAAQDPLGGGLDEVGSRLIAVALLEQGLGQRLQPPLRSALWGALLDSGLGLGADRQPPVISIDLSPPEIPLGETAVLTVSASDNIGVTRLDVTLDGTPLSLDANGQASLTPEQAGAHTVAASASDAAGNEASAQAALSVRDPGDTTAPVVRIESPVHEAVVTAPASIVITVADEHLVRWGLYLRSASETTHTQLASGTASAAAQAVATFDPSWLENGLYALTLEAEDAGGNQASSVLPAAMRAQAGGGA